MRLAPEALLDDLGAIVWEMDPATGHLTFVSAGAERILGYPAWRWVEEPGFWREHLHPDDRDRAVAERAQRLGRGGDGAMEYRMRAADGRIIWLRDLVRLAATDADGVSPLVHGVMVDVTAHRELEAELRASEERFARLSNASIDGVFVHEQGRIVDANDTAAALLGYAREELIGLTPMHLAVPEDRERLAAHIASGAETPLEGHARAKDGSPIPVEIRGRGVVVEGGVARVVVMRDLRERRRAEQALRDTELQLQQAQRLEAVGRLAGGIAHDFNNLLTVITGFTQIVRDGLGADHPHAADLEEVRHAAARAAELTRQLLAFSRKQVLQPAVLDLDEVVRDLEKMLRRVIGEQVRLRTEHGPGAARISADRGQVEQVLMNLVVNARDAMPDGGTITIRTAVVDVDEAFGRRHLGADVVPGRYARLDVADTGIGIDPAALAHIFEPFFTTKPPGSGTGLGLPMAYGIVKQSGGWIAVDSTPGQGATFSLFFPEAVEEPSPAPAPDERRPRGGAESILLVEDEDAVRDVARRILEGHGYRVRQARNATEALAIAGGGEPIDLLLTDLVMPGLGGRALADRLAAEHRDLRVLFMTGYTDQDALRRERGAQAPAVLLKPFTIESLVEGVRAALDRSPAA